VMRCMAFHRTACLLSDDLSSQSARLAPMAPRRYEQRLRAESATETRRRILDAVYERVRQAPAEAVSVERVAKMAGVARSTVYLIFESRAGLFDALAADVFDRAGYPSLLEAVRVEDAWESARGGIRAGVEIFAAERDVFRALSSMQERSAAARNGGPRAWRGWHAVFASSHTCAPGSARARPPTSCGFRPASTPSTSCIQAAAWGARRSPTFSSRRPSARSSPTHGPSRPTYVVSDRRARSASGAG
jgi:AcrR family transcriptional regulator